MLYTSRVNRVLQAVLKFSDDRDWKQYHTSETIAKSIVLESAELLEILQWKKNGTLLKWFCVFHHLICDFLHCLIPRN
jgi:NTP pyrophosphatase (non-canonical NTP hydrolase)